jgi:DNA-binding MarR family transcriptional regulator
MKIDDTMALFIRRLDVKITNLMRTKMEPYQIAPEQHLILRLLLERDGLTQNEIAQQLEKDKTNVARMVSSLEKKGFIIRVTSTSDRRYVSVHISQKGRILCEMVRPHLAEVNKQLQQGMTEEEKETLSRILHKIYKNAT